MKYALLLTSLLLVGCTGNGPTAPSASAPVPVTPAPAPTPPAPVFPSVAGIWNGTAALTVAAVEQGQSLTAVCNTQLTTSQTAGSFSGTLRISNSNGADCSGSLNYTGTVSQAGAIAVNLNWPFDDASCSLESIPQSMSGSVTNTRQSWKQIDVWLCQNKTIRVTRTIQIDVSPS